MDETDDEYLTDVLGESHGAWTLTFALLFCIVGVGLIIYTAL